MDEEAVHHRQQAARGRTGSGHPARGRQAARDGWTVQRNQRGPWRLLHDRGRRLRRSGGARARTSASRVRRHDRGQTSLRIVTTSPQTGVLLEHLFRHQAGRMVARLTRLLGPEYVALAEETVQDAMLRALQTWPYQGIPDNAAGWLFRVAHNVAIDALRRDKIFGNKTETIVGELTRSAGHAPDDTGVGEQFRDDELRMIFMCCHPALSRDASVALSLKIIGGFSVREIARAFLADEAAVAQRLVRAKRQIRDQRLTLDLPSGVELTTRLDSALEVIYFMFNEGYAAQAGAELIRQDLCMEA